ncbi:MAG: IS66 family transposase [Gammaproteobacteria bacterium]|nr:IS66 family transposase [Gammaproteobacteria bacterium]
MVNEYGLSSDERIGRLRDEVERLREELSRRERENARQKREIDGLRRQDERQKRKIEDLKRQLAAARRAGKRQAAPFAKDRPQGRGRRPGRRAGALYGRHARRPRPERVDQVLEAPVPTACPDCGGSVEVTRVASQYQEEIPKVRPVVRRFDIEVGHCSQCQRRVQGRHALQTSDALGAAGVQLGPGVVALVVELHTEMGVPLAKVARVLRTTFGLQVTPGGLAHLLHRMARDAAPTYRALCEQVRNAPAVTPDETGWRVGADSHWLWAFVTPETTVYAICPGRGFADATTVLGADFAGVLVRDGWVSYRCYRAALHQTCLNHLLQRCKELQEDHPDSFWAEQVQAVLQTGLAVRDRCNAGELSEHGLASVRGRLVARLGRLVDAPPPLDDAERFAGHLATEFDAVFLFLWDLTVDATNWRAEQAIRPAVVTRKVCGGNRTRHGADTQQVLASVVRTARQRDLALPPLLATMLRAIGPAVPDAFGLPPPSA